MDIKDMRKIKFRALFVEINGLIWSYLLEIKKELESDWDTENVRERTNKLMELVQNIDDLVCIYEFEKKGGA